MSETTTWWRAGTLSHGRIEPVQVVKETEKTLTIVPPYAGGAALKGQKVSKAGFWESYFPSEEEAAGWLISRAMDRVVGARRELEQAKGTLGNLKGKYPDHPAFQSEATS